MKCHKCGDGYLIERCDMEKFMEWISVKDRLPDHNQEIRFKGMFPFECEGFFEKTEKGFTFFHKSTDIKKIYSIYGITHWMPLPKLPNENG